MFVICDKIIPYATRMVIDERRENYSSVRKIGRVIESDHNSLFLHLNLLFEKIKEERLEVFQFRNKESQQVFKTLTSDTRDFTNCFKDDLTFEEQSTNWRRVLDSYFQK